MPDLETRRYVISGRVQGVGFRWFVEREAAQLGVTGWVRNCDNGDVEVMATGTREQHQLASPEAASKVRAPRVSIMSANPRRHCWTRHHSALKESGKLMQPKIGAPAVKI